MMDKSNAFSNMVGVQGAQQNQVGMAPDGGPIEMPPIGNDGMPLPATGDWSGQGLPNQPVGEPSSALLPPIAQGPAGATSMQGSMPGQALQQQMQQYSMPMGGTSNQMAPSMGSLMATQPQQPQQKGPTDWGQLFNPVGTAMEPNALVRAGVGYNQGGLIGSLGYLLTDMTRKNNQPQEV